MTLTLIVLGTVAFGICLGRIWDMLHARPQEQEDWDLQEIKAQVDARVAEIGKKPEGKVEAEKKVA